MVYIPSEIKLCFLLGKPSNFSHSLVINLYFFENCAFCSRSRQCTSAKKYFPLIKKRGEKFHFKLLQESLDYLDIYKIFKTCIAQIHRIMVKKWIDKKKAYNFAVVHRSREDPLYYDNDANDAVLVPINNTNKKRSKKNIRLENKTELEEEVLKNEKNVRSNEGEAAFFGIPFDDSKYDYMKHLKPIKPSVNSVFIPKNAATVNKNSEGQFKLKLPQETLPSKEVKYDYQRQQGIPDEISGFKPDLNADVREALTALEDDAYLDDTQDQDDTDVFGILLNGKKQESLTLDQYNKLEEKEMQEKTDEWDLDDFNEDSGVQGEVSQGDNFDWEKDFKKFKQVQTSGKVGNGWNTDDEFDSDEGVESEEQDVVGELPNILNKESRSKSKKVKRKKGAMTDTSSYSMSSSALCRTEQLSIIDDRFDVMKKKYDRNDNDEEGEEQPFDFKNERSDFASMVDDFLDNYEQKGKRIVKKDKEVEKIRNAADTVSKSKLAQRRRRQKEKKGVFSLKGLSNDMGNLKI